MNFVFPFAVKETLNSIRPICNSTPFAGYHALLIITRHILQHT